MLNLQGEVQMLVETNYQRTGDLKKVTPLSSTFELLYRKKYRSAYAKFRYCLAPIKLETCSYGLNRVPVHQRLCEEFNVVEDECHVIMYCTLYTDIRAQMFTEISEISCHFATLTVDDQFLQIMSNVQYYRAASRAMCNILNRRRCYML